MSIQFETDDACTVFLPEMPTVQDGPRESPAGAGPRSEYPALPSLSHHGRGGALCLLVADCAAGVRTIRLAA